MHVATLESFANAEISLPPTGSSQGRSGPRRLAVTHKGDKRLSFDSLSTNTTPTVSIHKAQREALERVPQAPRHDDTCHRFPDVF